MKELKTDVTNTPVRGKSPMAVKNSKRYQTKRIETGAKTEVKPRLSVRLQPIATRNDLTPTKP